LSRNTHAFMGTMPFMRLGRTPAKYRENMPPIERPAKKTLSQRPSSQARSSSME
jgi:hypothetical protein